MGGHFLRRYFFVSEKDDCFINRRDCRAYMHDGGNRLACVLGIVSII